MSPIFDWVPGNGVTNPSAEQLGSGFSTESGSPRLPPQLASGFRDTMPKSGSLTRLFSMGKNTPSGVHAWRPAEAALAPSRARLRFGGRVSWDKSSKRLGRDQESLLWGIFGRFQWPKVPDSMGREPMKRWGFERSGLFARDPRDDPTPDRITLDGWYFGAWRWPTPQCAPQPLTLLEKTSWKHVSQGKESEGAGQSQQPSDWRGQPPDSVERSSTGGDLSDRPGIQVVFLVLPLAVLLPEQGAHEAKDRVDVK